MERAGSDNVISMLFSKSGVQEARLEQRWERKLSHTMDKRSGSQKSRITSTLQNDQDKTKERSKVYEDKVAENSPLG